MHPSVKFIVCRPDESASRGLGSPAIPTIGSAASTFDAYRTVAIHSIENRPASWCMTDTDSAAALGRIIDGPIQSGGDIESAESALRAILFHDYVETLVPCLKAEYGADLVIYLRMDMKERNSAAFEAFQVASCFDRLIATEYVGVSQGKINNSSNGSSKLLGTDVDNIHSAYRLMLASANELTEAFSAQVGATTYFSSQELASPMNKGAAGFIDEMYRRIYRPWIDIAQSSPPQFFDLKLPPLLAIVLSRSNSRGDIPRVLKELRQELAASRSELNRLNQMIDACESQANIYAQTSHLNESFSAIVPEALMTDAERRKRSIVSVFNFIKPVRQIYSAAVDPLSVDIDKFQEIFRSTTDAVLNDSRIVMRSVPAAKMAELLKIGSVRESIQTHFTPMEIDLIARMR